MLSVLKFFKAFTTSFSFLLVGDRNADPDPYYCGSESG